MKTFLLSAALLAATATGACAQTMESVIGCWTMPSRAGESIQLNRSGGFTFSDYNAKTQAFETLYGSWTMSGKTITLMYEDRPKQRFMLAKSGKSWMMTKAGGFKFTKAQPADCTAEM
ncbi:MAG: hypothetical protein EOP52_05225 [Sphingobacteriales bacterium]|nr:MAG: hypothetical protein EOP52_05225 [Sphingobacteriales bacterium]